jgi:hypothetical protein
MAAKKVALEEKEAPTTSPQAEVTLSDLIWDKIKEVDLEVAALPNQTIEKHTSRVPLDFAKVHLIPKSGQVVPLIETKVHGKHWDRDHSFNVTTEERFVVVSIVPKK